jgi:YesN/AraC family two-component response regulator
MRLKYNKFLGTSSDKFHSKYCTVSLVNYKKPVSEDWHSHENIHLSLILQGGNLESRKKEDIQVSNGKIIAYNEGELHRNRFTSFPSKNLNLELKNEFFTTNDLAFNNLDLSSTKNIDIYLDLLKIYHELRINDLYTFDSIHLSLKSLFITNNESSFMPSWIKQLREIIEDRWNEFISLNELALELKVHPVTISKYFKKYYKGTLGDYMRKIKVQKALYFLLHTDMPITEIAFACGFSDHSHMVRVFKTYVGYNPKNIRQF